MSIIEAHVGDALVERFEPHAPPPRTPILDDVYTRAEDQALASWQNLKDHYKRWLNISLNAKRCPSWRRIEALINVRNAIAHGMGGLTRRMARKDLRQLRSDFATVDIVIDGNAVKLSENSIRLGFMAMREFLEWLDGELFAFDAQRRATP